MTNPIVAKYLRQCLNLIALMLRLLLFAIMVRMHCWRSRQNSPDLVFLDVEMPKMNGFEMLEQLTEINFHLIFTTSYDQYALKAIRFSAIDYLLKPIDREELKRQ